ncbi:MAG: O-antigen ligase family protein, partial [Planctomycetota bacterium]
DPAASTRPPHPMFRRVAVGLAVLWTVYCLNGFRSPATPIELSDNNAGSTLRQALFGGSALVAGIGLWMSGKIWMAVRKHALWAMLGTWMLATLTYSDEPAVTAKRAVLFWCGLCTAAFFVGTTSERHLERAARTTAVLCVLISGASLAWMALLPANISTNPGRPGLAGVSNHPNTLAPACAVGLIILSGLGSQTTTQRVTRWLGLAITGAALVLTGSVTSMFFAFVGVLVALLLSLGGYAAAIAFVLIAAAGVAMLLVGPAAVTDMVFASVNRDPSMSGRDELWGMISRQIRERPLFGHGWGAFWTEGKGREMVGTWNPRQSHNAYLDVTLDIGLIGLVVLLVPIGMTFSRLRETMRDTANPHTRQAAIATLALLSALLSVYALQQSFLGKPDSFAFAVVLWMSLAANREPANRVGGFSGSRGS